MKGSELSWTIGTNDEGKNIMHIQLDKVMLVCVRVCMCVNEGKGIIHIQLGKVMIMSVCVCQRRKGVSFTYGSTR